MPLPLYHSSKFRWMIVHTAASFISSVSVRVSVIVRRLDQPLGAAVGDLDDGAAAAAAEAVGQLLPRVGAPSIVAVLAAVVDGLRGLGAPPRELGDDRLRLLARDSGVQAPLRAAFVSTGRTVKVEHVLETDGCFKKY